MQTIIGAFDDRTTAERAVERLVSAGFDRSDVHLEQGSTSTTSTTTSTGPSSQEEGGIMGFFHRLFGDDDSADVRDNYSEAVRRGSSVVVVDAENDTQADRAAALLHELGAIDVDERAQQWRASGWTGGTARTGAGTAGLAGGTVAGGTTGTQAVGNQGTMKVVQEELDVGKKTMNRGGVRVVQRVTEKPVREIVRLREEHAVVDRKAVNRPATPEDLANFREGTVEVRETAEVPVVAKTARVVEEVRVGKEVREREETVEGTVRRRDVDVERLPGDASADRLTQTERERAVASGQGSTTGTGSADGIDRTTGTGQVRPGSVTGKDKPGI